jgi:hypothetical protein
MAVLTIELYSESISDLEKVFEQISKISLPNGVSWEEFEILTDLACPECDGDITGDFVDGEWWIYSCDLCNKVCELDHSEDRTDIDE